MESCPDNETFEDIKTVQGVSASNNDLVSKSEKVNKKYYFARSLSRRCALFAIVFFGSYLAFSATSTSWNRLETKAFISRLEVENSEDVTPAPMILVCPVHPFTHFNKTSKVEERFMKVLENIAFDRLTPEISNIIQRIGFRYYHQHSLRKIVFDTAISCENLFNNCSKGSGLIDCCKYFLPMYSEHGFCYASNTLYYDNVESQMKNTVMMQFYKDEQDHSVGLSLSKDSYIFVVPSYKQFDASKKSLVTAQVGDIWNLYFTMNENFGDIELSKFPISERKCVLDHELPTYLSNKNYTYFDCTKECHLNKTIELCECIPPFYGFVDTGKSLYNYCTFEYIPCLIEHRDQITSPYECKQCELSCSKLDLEIDKIFKSRLETDKDIKITVTIEPSPILGIQKAVQFGSIEFLASFGSILTLLIGYTILAIIEIIMCFLRAIVTYKQHI